MTEYIPQTSTSDRFEAARILLAAWDEAAQPDAHGHHDAGGFALRENERIRLMLRALITPPSAGESVEQIADRIALVPEFIPEYLVEDVHEVARAAAMEGIRAGIQYAHERWEPADVPSQEQMLRWLGIEHTASANVFIPEQIIERED